MKQQSASCETDRVCVGVITGSHGVKGAVRVKSFTADPQGVAAYGPVSDEQGGRRFTLRLTGSTRGQVIVRIDGIEDRDAAKALKGLRLYVPRTALPEPGEDEYYHADLLGLHVELADGRLLGTARALYDFGAGDLLEVERADEPPLLVPFTRAAVPVVDLEAGRIVVDLAPGLLEQDDRGSDEGGSQGSRKARRHRIASTAKVRRRNMSQ